MNLHYQGILDEQSHFVVVVVVFFFFFFFFGECFNFLITELTFHYCDKNMNMGALGVLLLIKSPVQCIISIEVGICSKV